jgi:hypothetical protein
VSDAAYEQAQRQFDAKDPVDLTLAIVAINGWNRLAIAFHADVGSHQPAAHPPADLAGVLLSSEQPRA